VFHVSDALRKGSIGPCAVALAATAAFGLPGSVGSVQAGDQPGTNVGSPDEDGQDATCSTYDNVSLPQDNVPTCNGVGGDGEDGASGFTARTAGEPSQEG